MVEELPRKALSIRQPWAYCIFKEGKDIENRNWPTSYRGPVCIHTSATFSKQDAEMANTILSTQGRYIPVEKIVEYRTGGIIGVVDIMDCVEQSDSPWQIWFCS